jgi:hypothetical protein
LYFGFNIAGFLMNLLIANEMFSIRWHETAKNQSTILADRESNLNSVYSEATTDF